MTTLRDYFPNIRTQQEILNEILSRKELQQIFNQWDTTQQKEFLAFCSGAKGVKILYNSFFKEIFNPEYTPERLNSLLSILLNRKVTILQVLPTDSTRLADETALVLMDIVVELDDGTIANLEVQKIGYAFPGQRAACYSADLLLRQYKRVRSKKKKNFLYSDIKDVYSIVFFEKSTSVFHSFPDVYLHHGQQTFDTGLHLSMLQHFLFIPLDIFSKILHNKGITTESEAWLAFLSMDDPEIIQALIEQYPFFQPMYEQIYDICLNTERVMEMFSKELQILDRNTVRYMIDELQKEVDQQKEELAQTHSALRQKDKELQEALALIEQLKKEK